MTLVQKMGTGEVSQQQVADIQKKLSSRTPGAANDLIDDAITGVCGTCGNPKSNCACDPICPQTGKVW